MVEGYLWWMWYMEPSTVLHFRLPNFGMKYYLKVRYKSNIFILKFENCIFWCDTYESFLACFTEEIWILVHMSCLILVFMYNKCMFLYFFTRSIVLVWWEDEILLTHKLLAHNARGMPWLVFPCPTKFHSKQNQNKDSGSVLSDFRTKSTIFS